LKQDDFCNNTL